ncbi:hypothetical protein PR048_016392 [Dryococelus australis]|uniref:Hexosyltransferase n=1 Tax=Dryococelus australis TaxID=614101 RepID=A0ABQ9HJL5_9NEOP|nr:hypothetical protein PR048_016392 [Dryococelus australis]
MTGVYRRLVKSEHRNLHDLDSVLVDDSKYYQEDILVPLSVNYNGSPIYPLYDSGFEINPEVCSGKNFAPELLIVVHSANFLIDLRTAIRYTWKHFDKIENTVIVFFLGRSDNRTITENVLAESAFFGDIVVSRTFDTYNNLTLKTISMCEWIDRFCPRAKFVLKADDDIFLNVPLLLDFIRQPEVKSAKRSVFGKLNHGTGPVRYPDHKFYISPEEYPGDVFLDYMQGASYLFTGDIAGSLFRTALQMNFFRMEDIFLTGFVSERIQARKVHVDRFYVLYFEIWHYYTENNQTYYDVESCNVKKLIAIHYVSYSDIFALWQRFFTRKVCK